jgi:acyl transferase domain-containing protein/phosphopantetheinyl transferase
MGRWHAGGSGSLTVGTPDDVAIIGMSGTFASAPDVSAYWTNILGKVDAIRDAPANWIGDDTIFDPAATPDTLRIYTKRGGFLGELAQFDPRPSGTMPVAMSGAEPDQFLALKASVSALTDAGYDKRAFSRERTGIILGHGIHANRANVNGIQHGIILTQTIALLRAVFPELSEDGSRAIEAMLSAKLPAFSVDSVPGLVPNMMTGRIANRLDLMGPNYIMDAACASSLLAIDAAVRELRNGRADMMLAGGINTSTAPLVYMVFCKIGALSRTSKIRPFDRSANGTLLGEGQGVVVLKRLADALRDGDHIYAVIKSTGSASDGRAMGLMAPRLEGEVLAMKRAYANSGIDPESIDLVEAHGTGIPLGDELEVQALTEVFGERRGLVPRIALGSVKSMIGHCIPAAGMASVIKMAMALDQKVLPPTLADEINPALGLERSPFFLNTEAMPWIHRRGSPRRAAIDAFGFGGINAHMILEEAPDTASAPTATFGLRDRRTAELFVLAADTRDELLVAARGLAEMAGQPACPGLRLLAGETAGKTGTGGHRLAVVASDAASLRSKLLGAIDKIAGPDVHRLRGRDGVFFSDDPMPGKLAFLFPGENSQYPHMLRDLALTSPAARQWFDRLEGLFHEERDVSHRFLLFPPSLGLTKAEEEHLETRLRSVDNGSEAVFFADIAIFSVLHALGATPDFVLGHSTGENAAIVAAGLVDASPDELGEYIRQMNAIFHHIEEEKLIPNGLLLVVGAVERAAIDVVLESHPEIHFTMDNCPNQVILFGPAPLMTEIRAKLAAQGAVCTALPLSWAYHTPFVAPMADAFSKLIRDEHIGKPTARLYSCASAGPFPEALDEIRELLRRQYVSRVRFTETVQRLHDDGARIFVEVGPGSVLTGFVGDILRGKPHLSIASDSSRGSSFRQMLYLLGQLFINHVPLRLDALYAEGAASSPDSVTSPFLESAVPFIRLNPDEAARLREILVDTVPASAPPPAIEPVTEPLDEVTAAPEPAGLSLQPPPPFDNFQTMDDFLEDQDLVPGRVIERQPNGHESPIAGWTGALALPFPAAIEFIGVNAGTEPMSVSAFTPHLGYGDLEYFERVILPLGPHRQRDWLIGRAAARRAIATWLSANGDGAAAWDCEIDYDSQGRPTLDWQGTRDAVFLSISHKDGVAVAAASDRPVGIDLERFSAVHDANGILRMAFSQAEAELLEHAGGLGAEFVTIAWSAKEAVSKSLGQKLLGRELSFAITALDARNSMIRVEHAGVAVDVFYAVDGDFVCSLAAVAEPALALAAPPRLRA